MSEWHNALLDLGHVSSTFRDDVLTGLGQQPKTLSCKYLYDDRGSQLFDQICELDEYYLTRTELAIMENCAGEMAAAIGPVSLLIEYGSGSSWKTRLLLDHLDRCAAYVPIDIARDHLERSARALSEQYPNVRVLPVCADFTQDFDLQLPDCGEQRRVVYFPGSTIGNFTADEAEPLLSSIANRVGSGGGLLIGLDLHKDRQVLEAAYNDQKGVTAEFILNLLRHINRELDGDFDVQNFAYVAFYNEEARRIEIYLESRSRQTVSVAGESFEFEAGERILAEYSHKYDLENVARIARRAGFQLVRHWKDDRDYFAVAFCQAIV
jgi:dimethylhistidine N-methyltransferase